METRKISDRISITKDKEFTRVEITQAVDTWKMWMLRVWVTLWIFLGVIFFYYAIFPPNGTSPIIMYVIIAFWAFFLFRIGKALLWRTRGKEIIHIEPRKMWIQNAIGKTGRRQQFNLEHVKAFGKIKEKNEFLAFMDNSFWVIGGDKLGFNYNGRRFQMGKQLSDREVRSLGQIMEKNIREYAKRTA